jgi:hypothetical protein
VFNGLWLLRGTAKPVQNGGKAAPVKSGSRKNALDLIRRRYSVGSSAFPVVGGVRPFHASG